ncbi:MAG TPA: type IV pilus biogenesis protein PilP [Alphaproteobacteria bacterium]|nr:type IV pilus biogenesis protein PilP [Alphaproteobacteria bacterium]
MTPLLHDRDQRSGPTVGIRHLGRMALLCAVLAITSVPFAPLQAQETGFAALAEKLIGSGDEWGQTIDLKDPCPAPQTGSLPPGDDLSTLQADIDRFTLCAERADMLRRLNEATLGKDAGGEEKTDTTPENPGFRLRNMPHDNSKKVAIPPVSEEDLKPPPAEKPAPPPGEWVIVNIFGSGAGLQVRLRKDDGSVAQARAGAVLSDGWAVKQVSTSGVVLTKGGQEKTLTWME